MDIQPWRPMRGHPKMKLGLELLIKLLPDDITGIEIGSYAGESAEIFAASGKFKKLICVDPWDPKYYKGNQLISAEERFDEVAAKYPCIEKWKMNGDQITDYITNSVNVYFGYIDGNHQKEYVKKDILTLKRIGVKIIAGHDFNFHKSPGVKEAVIETLGWPDARFCDYSWIKFLNQ